MSIAEQNRRESYAETNKTVVTVAAKIYEALLNYGPGSPWQIAEAMNRNVYTVRPRLTELCKMGKIKEVGTRWHELTQRKETVYDIVDKQLRLCNV